MSSKVSVKTTFEATRSIQPIYTGGEISSNAAGSLIATTVEDDILVIDLNSGKPLVRIDGDGESITSLSLSPNSSHLAVCSRSLSMRIYALTLNGKTINAELLRTLKPHTSPVVSSTIDSSGSLLVTGGADGTAKVWDIRGGYCSHTFHGHGGLVTALELFEINTNLLKRSSSSSRKRKIQGSEDIRMSDDSSTSTIVLASGGEDGKIKIWDLNSRKNIATLDSHVSVVRSIKYCAEKKSLLSASRDRTIVLWGTESWTAKRIIPALETLEAAGFLPGGEYCYSGGEHGRLRIWNTQSGKETTSQQEAGLETEAIVAVVQIKSEEAFLSVHQDQTMVLHSYKGLEGLPAGKVIPPLPIIRRISGNHDEIIDMACIGPDRSRLALATNTESIKIISLQENEDSGTDVSFGSDVALLEGHQDIIICMDVDWSGHWLATGAKDNTARLWRLDPQTSSYLCFAIFLGHAESLGAIALPKSPVPGSPAAKDPLNHPPSYLLTGSQDKTIKRWDTSKLTVQAPDSDPYNVAKSVFTRVAHEKDINALDISPIAPLFASASQDRTIKIWSVEDGSTVGILRGHKRGVWSVNFSPAGTPPIGLAEGGSSSSRGLLVSGSGDRTVKVWSLATYTCLLTFEGHSNSVLKVIWLPPPSSKQDNENPNKQRQGQNQPMIASASSDTLVKLWSPYASLDTDHLLTTLDNHTDRVWSLASPSPTQSSNLQQSSKKQSQSQAQSPSFTFISGAADATLTFWRDTTTQTLATQTKTLTARIEQDQLLQNHIHARNYRESIILSLTLNHPGRLLRILEDVVNLPDSQKEEGSIMGVAAVDSVLGSLSMFELYRLLERVRDWNTNARTAVVAQRVLNVLLRAYPASTWVDMARNQRRFIMKTEDDSDLAEGTNITGSSGGTRTRAKLMGMKDLFRALEVYTERHYKRMEELVDQSYLLEYTLREMDEVAGTNAVAVGSVAGAVNGAEKGELDADVIMF